MPKYTLCGSGETHYRIFLDEHMLRYTAFIGYGIVGKACHKAFEHNTEAIIIDPKYSDITIADLANVECKLTFISIPAPTLDDNSVDARVIYDIFEQLAGIKYTGLVVLKSTLPPHIVEDLYNVYGSDSTMDKNGPLRYIYSPEFIREGHWEEDAIDVKFVILAGSFIDCTDLKELYKRHSAIPQYCRFHITDYKEAALVKYSINSFLAMKVTFVNQIYQLYGDTYGSVPSADCWKEFTGMLSSDSRFGYSHLDVPGPDGEFGYGGSCLPKDVRAFIGYDKHNRLSILREVSEANTAIRLTGKNKSSNIE